MPAKRNTHTIAWQGWQLEIPRRWDPVKLEGDHAEGYALFADAARPRLGLRWQTPRQNRRFDPGKSVRLALQNEVGQLAATEAVPITGYVPVWSNAVRIDETGTDPVSADPDEFWAGPLLYTEPSPPGRDIFSVFSETSGRLLQVAYHAHRRERILADTILPTLVDLDVERASLWSIFDLNCVVPGEMKLKSHQLNAGDLGLSFEDRWNQMSVRQIAVARLALQRQPLDRWIGDHQQRDRRYHLPTGEFADAAVQLEDRNLIGRISRMTLRMRYRLLWNLPRVLTTIALHDEKRDRLVILHGSDESLLRQVALTVGASQS